MTKSTDEPMYAPESLVERLAAPDALVVTTFRLWVALHVKPLEVHQNWKTGLHVAGVAPWGLHAFDTMLWIALAAGNRALDVRCQNCSTLGRDEAWMLQMVNHAQFELHPEALEIMAGWMPRAPARAAMHHLTFFGHALTSAGLVVEMPAGGARILTAARPGRPPCPQGHPGPVTLH